jgi:HSP20 family protein
MPRKRGISPLDSTVGGFIVALSQQVCMYTASHIVAVEKEVRMALFNLSPSMDPFNALFSLQQELKRVFEQPSGLDLGVSGRGVFPPVNVFSDREGYVIRMEIPGVAAEDVQIDSQGRTLMISGKREVSAPENASFHRRERESGEFSRSLQLPDDVDLQQAGASYKCGMLTIRIPKKEEAKPRHITVQAA